MNISNKKEKTRMCYRKIILYIGIIIGMLSTGNAYAVKEYYPNHVGNLWILESKRGTQRHIEIVREFRFGDQDVNVLRRETKDGIDKFYIATEPGGDIKLYWSKVFNGFLGDLIFEYDSPQLFIPADLRVGKFWKISGETRGIDTQTTCTVVAKEDVTVPAGTFRDCFKIQQDFLVKAFRLINVQTFMWLAPDIGIVKEQSSTQEVFELIQYKLFLPWDVNHDQWIDIYDLVLVGKHFGERITGKPELNPDVNGDGIVNIFDLVLVGSHFGESTSL